MKKRPFERHTQIFRRIENQLIKRLTKKRSLDEIDKICDALINLGKMEEAMDDEAKHLCQDGAGILTTTQGDNAQPTRISSK